MGSWSKNRFSATRRKKKLDPSTLRPNTYSVLPQQVARTGHVIIMITTVTFLNRSQPNTVFGSNRTTGPDVQQTLSERQMSALAGARSFYSPVVCLNRFTRATIETSAQDRDTCGTMGSVYMVASLLDAIYTYTWLPHCRFSKFWTDRPTNQPANQQRK